MDGIIFDIEHDSFVDGPGIRTTIFFKGCNLKCAWCHNPESQSSETQLLFYKDRCTGCGKCAEVCPHGLRECTFCGKCELYCPVSARKVCGRRSSTEEVIKEVEKDISFYEFSGGGVTFSGGECMLQIDFLQELLQKCKAKGIHTAVDTAGNVSWKNFEKILPFTDLFLYDLKCYSEELHKKGTEVSNQLILENLKHLSGQSEIIIRIPIIPGFNTDIAELKRMADFLKTLELRDVELLPYHRMGQNKYNALGRKCPVFSEPSSDEMEKYKAIFAECAKHNGIK